MGKRNIKLDEDRVKRAAYLVVQGITRQAHFVLVAEMKARLPNVPYPLAKGQVTIWRKAAIAAGYPRCEECTMPISRSHWSMSITPCPTCRGLLGGYFDYKTMEDE